MLTRREMLRVAGNAALIAVIAFGPATAASAQAASLNGAGATFPAPLYSKWGEEYYRQTNVKVNYQSIGSGGGIKSITDKTVDFGATDGPMTDQQLRAAKGGILHIPAVAGAVVVTYNLPTVSQLKFTGELIADVFLGKVAKWNDDRIAALNPGVTLPNDEIIVVHRSDGSGTTNIFTDYLSKVSDEWKTRVGSATSVNWPTGLGGRGNEGVAGEVKQNQGTIGYVELAYAEQNKLAYAQVQNRDGNYITPSLAATTAAVAGAIAEMPNDFRLMITNEPGADAYPIAGFTWLLVYKEQDDRDKGIALVRYLTWTQTEGQNYAESLHYARIPEALQSRITDAIKSITYDGQSLYGQ